MAYPLIKRLNRVLYEVQNTPELLHTAYVNIMREAHEELIEAEQTIAKLNEELTRAVEARAADLEATLYDKVADDCVALLRDNAVNDKLEEDVIMLRMLSKEMGNQDRNHFQRELARLADELETKL